MSDTRRVEIASFCHSPRLLFGNWSSSFLFVVTTTSSPRFSAFPIKEKKAWNLPQFLVPEAPPQPPQIAVRLIANRLIIGPQSTCSSAHTKDQVLFTIGYSLFKVLKNPSLSLYLWLNLTISHRIWFILNYEYYMGCSVTIRHPTLQDRQFNHNNYYHKKKPCLQLTFSLAEFVWN